MNRMQKIAVFNLVVFGSSLLLTIVAVITLYCFWGWPKASAGLGFLGFAGLGGFSPLIFKKDHGAVTFDERDKLIHRTSALAGFACSYGWFCAASMIPFFLYGPRMQIEVRWLAWLPLGGLFIVETVRSITLLAMYGRGGRNE
ncbi:MAG: hypothetical protein ACYC3B_00460 [Sedimentisphaerales bacterium]